MLASGAFCFAPRAAAVVLYLVEALPLAGNLLRAFVPLKGPARALALANLVVIALGLALMIVARQMTRAELAGVEQAPARSQERLKQFEARAKENSKEMEKLRKRLTELQKTAAAGGKEAEKQMKALSKEIDERAEKRAEEVMAEAQAAYSPGSQSSGGGFWIWIDASGRFQMLLASVQIIILACFIFAIARALDDKGLADNCALGWPC
jgi:hypothetical protein